MKYIVYVGRLQSRSYTFLDGKRYVFFKGIPKEVEDQHADLLINYIETNREVRGCCGNRTTYVNKSNNFIRAEDYAASRNMTLDQLLSVI